MRTGKLSISRGHRAGDSPAPAPRLVLVPREVPAAPPARTKAAARAPAPALVPAPPPEYQPAHDRLAALERLARLMKQGALTPDEFAFEKARILAQGASELLLERQAPVPEPQGPSLAGRLFSWKFVPVALVAGIGLSYVSQPRETSRFFEDCLRLLGL